MLKKYIVSKDYHASRFDRWFKHNIRNIPQSLIEKLLRKKNIKINNKKAKTSYRVQFNDVVEIYGLEKLKDNQKKSNIKYKPTEKEKTYYNEFTLENNENFIVINKPVGIPVQGGTKSFKNIIDILKDTKYFNSSKPFIVHRLDKETSGVMIIAKNREYAQLFTSLFRIRKIHKTYLAITHGQFDKKIKLLKNDLITYEKNKKIVQKAITYVRVLKSNNLYSLLELKPITGRKHQLRKQLHFIGYPVVGDDKYFLKIEKNKNKNLMLHAYRIKFMLNNKKFNYQAKYSIFFEKFLNKNLKS
tara:strand:- start:354 stop:1256 length:903 start_codon:yes stop_codon:yes gene_type:complete